MDTMNSAKVTTVTHLGNMMKVPQGKAVVEEQAAGNFMIVMPDGAIQLAVTHRDAERRIKAWFKRNLEHLVKTTRAEGLIGIGTIEWRML